MSTDDGGYDIIQEDATQSASLTVAHVGTPWATDAVGTALPTNYTYSDGTLVQHINTTGAVYPVVADAHYTWGWVVIVAAEGSRCPDGRSQRGT